MWVVTDCDRARCVDGRGHPGGPVGQLRLRLDGDRETAHGGAGNEHAEGRAGTPEPGLGHEAERRSRPLSREEISRSADLQRRYAAEYASMLRVVSDREVARDAARINVSALLVGQPRIVLSGDRFTAGRLRIAISRGGDDLGAIRRAVSGLLERAAPAIERPPVPR